MKLKRGASDSSRVPTTQEDLGKNLAQLLPAVYIKSSKKTVETEVCTGLNKNIYQRWLVQTDGSWNPDNNNKLLLYLTECSSHRGKDSAEEDRSESKGWVFIIANVNHKT